jgi:MFS family permease
MSQWAGNGLISYYLSLILNSIGITESFDKTLINGILQIFNFASAIFGALLVDRMGRRPLWLWSIAGMFVSYIVWTACSAVYDETSSRASAMAVLVLIFIYQFHYAIAITPFSFSKGSLHPCLSDIY